MYGESIITFSTGVEVLQTSPKNKEAEHSNVFRSIRMFGKHEITSDQSKKPQQSQAN